ncbi:uncharacterized protein TrAFT101_010939 [Trichoderma asperellum]|uniref:uncharacterized protein n=1 Tax=Trichoderma asperellum TaxID=101201 RepID=UPI00332A52E6|nr:hypothetical protein TrAFT101_010939 [Trichoderma asperellum]
MRRILRRYLLLFCGTATNLPWQSKFPMCVHHQYGTGTEQSWMGAVVPAAFHQFHRPFAKTKRNRTVSKRSNTALAGREDHEARPRGENTSRTLFDPGGEALFLKDRGYHES